MKEKTTNNYIYHNDGNSSDGQQTAVKKQNIDIPKVEIFEFEAKLHQFLTEILKFTT